MNTRGLGLGSKKTQGKTHLDGATIATRNSVGNRQWGMFFTVTDDPTPANNTTWVLVKGLVDDSKANNNNWQTIGEWLEAMGISGGASPIPEFFTGDGVETEFTIS